MFNKRIDRKNNPTLAGYLLSKYSAIEVAMKGIRRQSESRCCHTEL
jgi:hypothetical protein